jgi:hypothetical protein
MVRSLGIMRLVGRRSAIRAWCVSALFCTLALVPSAAQEQIPPAPAPNSTASSPDVDAPEPKSSPPVKERFLVDRFPDKPSLPPAFTIPIEPLGFTAPGANYMGQRNTMASLDFLDENRVLLTFRIPGLLRRDPTNNAETDERQIRAVVLALPKGTVEAEATWTVHDRVRYLWPLKDGHFLVRDRNNLYEGDATLALKPYLDFPGSLLWLELDPDQQFLVTNSREPAAKPTKPEAPEDGSTTAAWKPGEVSSPSSASATITSDQDSPADVSQADLVVRILRRDSGEVMLVSRVRAAVHLPINSIGYLENLRSRGTEWILNLNYYTGGSKMLGRVASTCEPDDEFLSEQEILATTCGSGGESGLVAVSTAGRTLWETKAPPTEIWPQMAVAANGSRLAWETLDANHSIYAYAPLDAGDIKEQSVTVFDAANGDIDLVSPVSPILDAGGNVAISPSGRRVALLNAGAVQVFELPPPPPLHGDSTSKP